MKLAALVGFISVICLLLAECEPIPPQPPPPKQASATPTCDRLMIHNGNDFVAKKVFLLSAVNYRPQRGKGPSPSDIIRNVAPTDPYWNDLTAAFTLAPDFFKDKLCGLTKVFIVQCAQSRCTADEAINNSWGLREWPEGTGEYIATSAALWQNSNSAPPFNQYQNKRLQLLFDKLSNGRAVNWPNKPTYADAKPNNSPAMSVLAALAHEFGHVLWYDTFVRERGGPFSPNPCNGTFFYETSSWSRVDVPPRRWIEFGQTVPNEIYNPDYVGALQRDLNPSPTRSRRRISPDFPQAGEDLHAIFRDLNLAGALASVSPDEDFVEAYTLYVLLRTVDATGARQLKSLEITIKGRGSNVFKDDIPAMFQDKNGLAKKVSCFGPPPTP